MMGVCKIILQFLVLCVLTFAAVDVTTATGCVWNLNLDLPETEPIYFTTSLTPEVVIPTAAGLSLALNEKMVMVCPSKSNTILSTGVQELTVSCGSGNTLLYQGVNLPLKFFECFSNTLSDLVQTKLPCAGGKGEIMNLGFTSSKGLAPMVDVCYDKINEAVLFSINVIYGKAIAIAEIESTRPQFRTPGLTYGTTTANLYKQTEQMTRFTALLGLRQAQKYLNTTSFLARGHLAPDGDYLFGSWSTATYFFVNAAPEWQIINAGNWLTVENTARQIAGKRQEDLTIITGVHGVSQLPDINGNMVDLYLMAGNKLPVPKWYWKILYSSLKQEGIAFVTANNPHLDYISEKEMLCRNICKEVGFNKTDWTNYLKGFTYCCDVNELLSTVGTLPPINISGRITNF